MVVNVKSMPQSKSLCDISAGTCFMRGSDIFIKTNETDPDGDIQVVNLKDGNLHRYPADNEVFIINAKIISMDEQHNFNIPNSLVPRFDTKDDSANTYQSIIKMMFDVI